MFHISFCKTSIHFKHKHKIKTQKVHLNNVLKRLKIRVIFLDLKCLLTIVFKKVGRFYGEGGPGRD
jgi:hypothetical protein